MQEHLYFLRFEDLVARPVACLSHLYAWLGVSAFEINPEKLAPMGPPESDSHYRMKYPHSQAQRIVMPSKHDIPPRIQARIEDAYSWFYQTYYPGRTRPPA